MTVKLSHASYPMGHVSCLCWQQWLMGLVPEWLLMWLALRLNCALRRQALQRLRRWPANWVGSLCNWVSWWRHRVWQHCWLTDRWRGLAATLRACVCLSTLLAFVLAASLDYVCCASISVALDPTTFWLWDIQIQCLQCFYLFLFLYFLSLWRIKLYIILLVISRDSIHRKS